VFYHLSAAAFGGSGGGEIFWKTRCLSTNLILQKLAKQQYGSIRVKNLKYAIC
jgi:hypothetical protein